MSKYKNAELVWVQEEHRNMGGWKYASERINIVSLLTNPILTFKVAEQLNKPQVKYVGRTFSASPAVGSAKTHKEELATFLREAFE